MVSIVRSIVSVLVLALSLVGCESGHLWSLYSLGFTERDAYIDTLGDARDSLRNLVEDVEQISVSQQLGDGEKARQLRNMRSEVKNFKRELSTSRNAAGDWFRHWSSRPEKYLSNHYSREQAEEKSADIQAQAKLLIQEYKALASLAKTGFYPTTADWQQQARSWLQAANDFLSWLETDDSGYPKDMPLIF